jgi:hypothetical protein
VSADRTQNHPLKQRFDDPVIAVYKQHVDRSLLRANLRLTVEERLLKLQSAVAFANALREAGKRTRFQGKP